MALPPRLEQEVQALRDQYQVEVCEEGDWINLTFVNFPIGDGFSVASSNLLIRVQRTYPDAGPDMFWLDVAVLLSNGRPPQAAESVESYLGRSWRRFSWHRQSWNPSIDNLHGYLEFIRRRLRENK